MPRKFVKHTGILNRHIASKTEVELAVEATLNLVQESGCDLKDCAGLVFASPSFVPMPLAQKYLDEGQIQKEQLNRAAEQFSECMRIQPRRMAATNSYCAGFAEALSLATNDIQPAIELKREEFILVLTSNRISRITDYSCKQSSALFGDMATATIISRLDSNKYPVQFELLSVNVEDKPVNRPFFEFSLKHNVLTPTPDGGKSLDPARIVFSLDGMGIADTAPRAMALAANEMLEETGWSPEDVDYLVPHQAGSAIVRLAEMKLRESGFTGEVVNEMAREVGNVSSCSIPYTLREKWQQLSGNILCPVASVGTPGEPLVKQGCIALRKTFSQLAAAS